MTRFDFQVGASRGRSRPSWGVLVAAMLLCGGFLPPPSFAQEPSRTDEEEPREGPPRTTFYKMWGGQGAVVTQKKIKRVDPEKKAAVESLYRSLVPDQAVSRELMLKLYAAGDFETVKSLIEDGVISTRHSLEMADLRIVMTMEVFREIAKENGWRIFRSDSGNQSAGMSSDIDQTVYVYVRDANGHLQRVSTHDAVLVAEFTKRFDAKYGPLGVTVAKLDIATIAGRDKFPDWRVVTSQLDAEAVRRGSRQFKEHAFETMESLRDTPGAYTYCGAVVQQMQLRALALIDERLRERALAGTDLATPDEHVVKKTIERDGQEVKVEERYGLHPDLVDLGLKRLGWLVCCEIGPEGPRETFIDGESGRPGALDVMFDGLRPGFVRGHAYDAAVANYLEFRKHLSDKNPAVKYHLRALDDGMRMLAALEARERAAGTASVREPAMYEELDAAGDNDRRQHLERVLGDVGAETADRWRVVFDISAEMRRLHKKNQLNDESAAKAYEPLARLFAGADEDWHKPVYLEQARQEYNRRCQEFLVYNIVGTAQERVLEWVNFDSDNPKARPDVSRFVDEDRVREAMRLTPAEWESVKAEVFRNYSDLARIQLLFSFRELPPELAAKVLRANNVHRVGGVRNLMQLQQLAREAQSRYYFHYARWKEMPGLYTRVYGQRAGRWTTKQVVEFGRRQGHELLLEAGIKNGHPSQFFSKFGFERFNHTFNEYFAASGAGGMARRFVRNTLFDAGNLSGALSVARSYSETGGDWDATQETLVNELIYALPVVGKVKSLYDAESNQDRAFVLVCMLVPQAGLVTLVHGVGETGLVLYEYEYSRPLANTAADAVYRGYVGPSLYYFEQKPPEFTDDDRGLLRRVQDAIEDLRAKGDNQSVPLTELLQRERQLRIKRDAWDSFWSEHVRHEGGALRRALADNYWWFEGVFGEGHTLELPYSSLRFKPDSVLTPPTAEQVKDRRALNENGIRSYEDRIRGLQKSPEQRRQEDAASADPLRRDQAAESLANDAAVVGQQSRLALLVGDAGQFRRALQWIDDRPPFQNRLQAFTDGYVLLFADRAAAAELFQRGWQAEMEQLDLAERALPQNPDLSEIGRQRLLDNLRDQRATLLELRNKYLPAWWPYDRGFAERP